MATRDDKSDQGARCPECGVALEGLSPYKHSLVHWSERISDDPTHAQALDRQRALRAMETDPKYAGR